MLSAFLVQWLSLPLSLLLQPVSLETLSSLGLSQKVWEVVTAPCASSPALLCPSSSSCTPEPSHFLLLLSLTSGRALIWESGGLGLDPSSAGLSADLQDVIMEHLPPGPREGSVD